jgi:hypothetical protein
MTRFIPHDNRVVDTRYGTSEPTDTPELHAMIANELENDKQDSLVGAMVRGLLFDDPRAVSMNGSALIRWHGWTTEDVHAVIAAFAEVPRVACDMCHGPTGEAYWEVHMWRLCAACMILHREAHGCDCD